MMCITCILIKMLLHGLGFPSFATLALVSDLRVKGLLLINSFQNLGSLSTSSWSTVNNSLSGHNRVQSLNPGCQLLQTFGYFNYLVCLNRGKRVHPLTTS